MTLNRKEIFYFCAVKMKRKLIQHSIIFIIFICFFQMTGKVYVDFSGHLSGNDEPLKSTICWAVLSDVTTSTDEAIQTTEQHPVAFTLSFNREQWLASSGESCFISLSVLKDGHIPLHLFDSSPPIC